MAINQEDGDFALHCWIDANSEDVENAVFYSNSMEELQKHAEALIEGDKFTYITLSRWDAAGDDWEEVEIYTEEEEAA